MMKRKCSFASGGRWTVFAAGGGAGAVCAGAEPGDEVGVFSGMESSKGGNNRPNGGAYLRLVGREHSTKNSPPAVDAIDAKVNGEPRFKYGRAPWLTTMRVDRGVVVFVSLMIAVAAVFILRPTGGPVRGELPTFPNQTDLV